MHSNEAVQQCLKSCHHQAGKLLKIELVFLCPMNLIGGVVGGKGFASLVQAFVFLETISVSVMSRPVSILMKLFELQYHHW